ncbi:MAG TPA: hypothetical protein VEK08_00290 [Planctomycetota bacterium]|nr:hypothetical protein [Planctomycetota bacterium]
MKPQVSSNGDRKPKGSALIVALALIALLASISAVLVSEMTTRAKHVEVDLEDIKAFEAAEAGIDAALFDINSSDTYNPWVEANPTVPPNQTPSAVKPPLSKPYARRVSKGVLPNSQDPAVIGSAIPLIAPETQRPIRVHVARRADGTKPGCLGTSAWMPSHDLDKNGRPTWRSIPMTNSNGEQLKYSSGPNAGKPRYCEDGIVPQALGSVAFFTYAIDWYHDGIDNDADGVVDDRNERNKYTVYSTGIHRGIMQSGVTESGKVVTVEVIVQALDKDRFEFEPSPLRIPIAPRRNP